jgi:hypothetical protein
MHIVYTRYKEALDVRRRRLGKVVAATAVRWTAAAAAATTTAVVAVDHVKIDFVVITHIRL